MAATPGEVLGEHASSLDDDGLKDSLGGTRDREAKRLMRVKARMLGYKKVRGFAGREERELERCSPRGPRTSSFPTC